MSNNKIRAKDPSVYRVYVEPSNSCCPRMLPPCPPECDRCQPSSRPVQRLNLPCEGSYPPKLHLSSPILHAGKMNDRTQEESEWPTQWSSMELVRCYATNSLLPAPGFLLRAAPAPLFQYLGLWSLSPAKFPPSLVVETRGVFKGGLPGRKREGDAGAQEISIGQRTIQYCQFFSYGC